MSASGSEKASLKIVPDETNGQPTGVEAEVTKPAARPPESGFPRDAGWLWSVAGVGLAVLLGFLAYQSQRAQRAEDRVAVLTQELQGAQQEIAMHEARMESVRGAVNDLAARIGLLQETVSESQPAASP